MNLVEVGVVLVRPRHVAMFQPVAVIPLHDLSRRLQPTANSRNLVLPVYIIGFKLTLFFWIFSMNFKEYLSLLCMQSNIVRPSSLFWGISARNLVTNVQCRLCLFVQSCSRTACPPKTANIQVSSYHSSLHRHLSVTTFVSISAKYLLFVQLSYALLLLCWSRSPRVDPTACHPCICSR